MFSTSPRMHMTGDLVGCGVEVAGDDDAGVGVGVEDLVDEPADLQGLGHAFHRGNELILRPTRRRSAR